MYLSRPIEIRLTIGRLSLVSRVPSSNDEYTKVILNLVRKLGFKDELTAEVKTLGMVHDVALWNEVSTGRARSMSK